MQGNVQRHIIRTNSTEGNKTTKNNAKKNAKHNKYETKSLRRRTRDTPGYVDDPRYKPRPGINRSVSKLIWSVIIADVECHIIELLTLHGSSIGWGDPAGKTTLVGGDRRNGGGKGAW